MENRARRVRSGTAKPARVEKFIRIVIIATMTWALFAFGAVYAWAYRPIWIASSVAGIAAICSSGLRRALWRTVGCGLIGFVPLIIGIAVQIAPVDTATVAALSPAADRFLADYELSYRHSIGQANGSTRRHSLSLESGSTVVALTFVLTLTLLLCAAAALASRTGPEPLVIGVLVIGTLAAVIAVLQRATFNERIYWFWKPDATPNPAGGPFVNRNHFAGWLLMAIPLTLGYVLGRIEAAMRGIAAGWRTRVLWFSTADASALVTGGFGVALMVLALFLTVSRSGIACLLLALVIGASIVIHRRAGALRTLAAVGYISLLVLLGILIVGIDPIANRFAQLVEGDLRGRVEAWTDTLHVIRDFPLVGSGLNTFSTVMLSYQTTHLESHYAQAHNDYLQLAAEGGILLSVASIILAVIGLREVKRRFAAGPVDRQRYWIRTGAVTGLVAIALQEMSDFSLQMPGNSVLFTILWAIALHQSNPVGGAAVTAARTTKRELSSNSGATISVES